MVFISAALWLINAIALSVLIFRTLAKSVKSKKNHEQEPVLGFREKKMWVCAIVVSLFLSRFLMVSSLFQEGSNIAIGISVWKKYLWKLFLSFLWPPQLPVLLGSIVLLATNRALEHSRGILQPKIHFDTGVLIGSCSAFLILTAAGFIIFHLEFISAEALYFVSLYGKCIAIIAFILSMSEQPQARRNNHG